jgi:putative lipoic acid-binding regulatory protein
MSEDSEQLLEFPCEFPVKIMGRESPEFHTTVRSLVERHTGPLDESAIRSTLSRNGRFVSITITVSARSREQLDAIYIDVSGHEDVLMAL